MVFVVGLGCLFFVVVLLWFGLGFGFFVCGVLLLLLLCFVCMWGFLVLCGVFVSLFVF